MYCGSNKTALQSQRQIARAMMALIREKPYAQITISELCCAGRPVFRGRPFTAFLPAGKM